MTATNPVVGHSGEAHPGRLRVALTLKRPGVASLLALALYALVSFLYFDLRILTGHENQLIGMGADPQIFVWSLAWWPHAIAHDLNPFVTDLVWAPGKTNLAWITSVPGLALLFLPVTLLAGPFASYNAAMVVLPALAAWTAYLLCRRLTGLFWPSLVGGYLFGFSSYMLGQTSGGHPNLAFVAGIPLAALVIVRWVERDLRSRWLALSLGAIFGLQLLVSTEVALTMTVMLVTALVLAVALLPAHRARIAHIWAPLAWAALVAAVIAAPLLYYLVSDFQPEQIHITSDHYADLLNFAIPTPVSLLSFGWTRDVTSSFRSNYIEEGAYLGLPVLVIVGLYAWSRIRTAGGRFLVACFGAAILLSLGSRLTVAGHFSIPLPWALIGGRAPFNNVLTERLVLYVSLGPRRSWSPSGQPFSDAAGRGSLSRSSPSPRRSRTSAPPPAGPCRTRCRPSSPTRRTATASTWRDRPSAAGQRHRQCDALAGRGRLPVQDGRRLSGFQPPTRFLGSPASTRSLSTAASRPTSRT